MPLLILEDMFSLVRQNQVVGGPFQDALGVPLANGYLIMKLQHDGAVNGAGQIVGNMAVYIPLDSNGSILGTVNLWPNDLMLPSGGTYVIWAYDSANRLAWDNPQVQQVLSSPSPFNVNAWIPGP